MALTPPKDLTDLQRALRSRLGEDARFDPYTRILYSTDASNYQIEPLGVYFPRHEEDLARAVEVAREFGVPILPRGAGTSLAGQAVGAALILDCARHLDQIHRLVPEEHLAEVGPGVVGAALNAAAKPHGLMFGPDPASADRATFGGMIATNATGAHSIRYGMTADHLLEAEVVLSDGSPARLGPMGEDEAKRKAQATTLEGRIYRAALGLREGAAGRVRQDWPRVWRRASGYSLDYLVGFSPGRPPGWYADPEPYPPWRGFSLAPLLCGSEGTLAIIRRATVNLVARPGATVLVILGYRSIPEACDAAPEVLRSHPAAIELIPRSLLERARGVPEYARRVRELGETAEAILVVEFEGETPAAALAAASPLRGKGRILEAAEAQANLWAVRKVGLGLLLSVPGDVKPVSFIEDVTVPVENLGDYVRRVDRLLADNGTTAEWYAHASAGCLHVRPLLNLRTARGVGQMRAIAEGILRIVLEMRGVLSGEHGDGLAHTEFNEQLFGRELMQAFREVKQAFDPEGALNPGKVVPTEGHAIPVLDQNLRFGPGYHAAEVTTIFAHRREGGFAHAIEECNGAGVCLQTGGVMCPSYQATREEMHTTRGRANALRAALSGRLPPGSLTSHQMYEVLDLCLECKGCKAECPSAVDMARVKSEFLSLYQAEHGVPLRSRLFGEIASVSRLAPPFAGLINRVARARPTRWLLEQALSVSRHRTLPPFAGRTFRRQFARLRRKTDGDPVVLFVDTFVNYNHPQIGLAAVEVLEAAGYRVMLAPRQACCGRAMISKGLLRRARRQAAHNIEALTPFVEDGVPIIGLEPSCLVTLRDEYLEFFPHEARAHALAGSAFLIEEFLTRHDGDGSRPIDRLRFRAPQAPILVHGHCQAKAIVGTAPLLEILRATGASVREIDSGCCGMAGSFGYEAEHYRVSMQIGGMRLFPAVRQGEAEGSAIAAAGASCRAQIRDGTGVAALHPVEILARALAPEGE
jgi:FAD/FMN-containing dehydrogenase/Fe-S oxidoreductase